MMYLLDTNVVSELRKRGPDPHVQAWYSMVTSAEIFISALTIGEIRLGIEQLRRKDAAQADLLEQWLRGLHAGYGDHIIDVDAAAAEEWAGSACPTPFRSSTGCSPPQPRSGAGLWSPGIPRTSPAAVWRCSTLSNPLPARSPGISRRTGDGNR